MYSSVSQKLFIVEKGVQNFYSCYTSFMKNKFYQDLSILIVEDELESMEELQYVMELYFGFVHTAVDGCEGLELIEKYHPDIVFSDIDMPCMNGVDMLKEARKISSNSVFIFATAHNDTDYLLSAIDIKVDAYLMKPVQLDIVFEKLENILKGRVLPTADEKDKNRISESKLSHQGLSKREYEVFLDIAKGIKPNHIAQKYEIKPKTISTYRKRIFEKMCVNSNAEIIRYAITNHLI